MEIIINWYRNRILRALILKKEETMRWQLIKYFRKNQSSVSGVFSSKESSWSFLSTSLYFILFYFCFEEFIIFRKNII